MKIALTQRRMVTPSGSDPGWGLSRDWIEWIAKWLPGALVMGVPNSPETIRTWWNEVQADCLILTGGDDLGRDPERDATEQMLLDHVPATVPKLGVCRGAQLINCHYGGSIGRSSNSEHAGTVHEILVRSGAGHSVFRTRKALVNSYHHYVISEEQLAEDLTVLAQHGDTSIEAFLHTHDSCLGVMWHPERFLAGNNELNGAIASFLRRQE